MSKHVEAEGGELLIRSSKGYMAIVPKNMASWVKEHISSGNHAVVDNYIKGLKEMKTGEKAKDGMKMSVPVKKVVVDKTYVAPAAMPMLGQAKPAIITETADITKMIPLVAGMRVMSKMFKKQK